MDKTHTFSITSIDVARFERFMRTAQASIQAVVREANNMSGRTAKLRAGAVLRRINLTQGHPVGVEVGVFQGIMSMVLLAKHPGLFLYMVDNWVGCEQQPDAYRATGDYHAQRTHLQQAQAHTRAIKNTAQFRDRRAVIQQASADAVLIFPDESCDFVFLDADHSYQGTLAAINEWWPKVEVGGWLCGHDYYDRAQQRKSDASGKQFDVNRAVNESAIARGRKVDVDVDGTWFIQKQREDGRRSPNLQLIE